MTKATAESPLIAGCIKRRLRLGMQVLIYIVHIVSPAQPP